jgi:RyR domain
MTGLFLGLMRAASRLAALATRQQGPAQAIAGALALGLGLWGWSIKEPPTEVAVWFNNIFRTLQLITLQFPTNLEAGIPWQLQVARLLVPLVAVFATFNVLVGAITRPVRLALMPYTVGHVVVCGAEQLTEAALKTLAGRGRRIVTVASRVDPTRREALEGLGLTIIEADPFQAVIFSALNLAKAAALFLTHEDELANLDLAMLALSTLKQRPADMRLLVLGVMIEGEDLACELDATLDGLARKYRVQYQRLCPDRDGLRLELRRFAPVFLKADRAAPSRLLVVGLCGNWQQIVMQLVVSSQDHPDARPLISLVLDEAEAAAFTRWRATKPDIDLVARFEVVPRGEDILPPAKVPPGGRVAHPAPEIVVVLRPDCDAVTTALVLRRADNPFGLKNQPILVRRSKEDRILARLAETGAEHRNLNGLVPFGGLVRSEAIERVLDWRGDEIAITLHAKYRDDAKTLGVGSPAALAEWDDLPENLRNANRAIAEHAPILFASIGLPLTQAREGAAHVLTAEDIEILARVEHRRWMADRIDRGWRSGPVRDDVRLIHPSLAPFERLSAKDREKAKNAVRVLIDALASAGWRIA